MKNILLLQNIMCLRVYPQCVCVCVCVKKLLKRNSPTPAAPVSTNFVIFAQQLFFVIINCIIVEQFLLTS
jgi:hypothetical protein